MAAGLLSEEPVEGFQEASEALRRIPGGARAGGDGEAIVEEGRWRIQRVALGKGAAGGDALGGVEAEGRLVLRPEGEDGRHDDAMGERGGGEVDGIGKDVCGGAHWVDGMAFSGEAILVGGGKLL